MQRATLPDMDRTSHDYDESVVQTTDSLMGDIHATGMAAAIAFTTRAICNRHAWRPWVKAAGMCSAPAVLGYLQRQSKPDTCCAGCIAAAATIVHHALTESKWKQRKLTLNSRRTSLLTSLAMHLGIATFIILAMSKYREDNHAFVGRSHLHFVNLIRASSHAFRHLVLQVLVTYCALERATCRIN